MSSDPGDDDVTPAHGETDLAHLALLVRRAVATIDSEARERLEAAWVALTSAIKQPKQDAAKIKARVARLRGEIERALGARGSDQSAESVDSSEHREQITRVAADDAELAD